jgi:hypothetical protein
VSTEHPDSLMINAYLEGRLNHKEMYRLEKQALTDPFLWEALEGYEYTSNPDIEISILQRQLHERIVHLQENKKVFDFTWQRLSVAASASVLFITAGILFWMNINRPGLIAERQVEVSLIDRDSLINEIQGKINRPVISEKKYAGSLDETRISVYGSPSGSNAGSELNNSLKSSTTDIGSNGTVNHIDKVGTQEQGTLGRILSSSVLDRDFEQQVQPVPGWEIYRKYMEENIGNPGGNVNLGGSVLLSFELDKRGKPVNFRILKSLTKAHDEEAIRLIKNGPAWKMIDGSKINRGNIEVRF